MGNNALHIIMRGVGMASVILGFLGAALLACAVVIVPALIINFFLGCFRVLFSLFKREKQESLSETQVVTGVVILSTITSTLLLFFTGFSNEKAIIIGVLLTSCIAYISTLIYILNVDIKVGKEGRIELGTLATLILIFISILALIWGDLTDDNSNQLMVVGTITAIIAVELALLGVMIAFLSHKRKSGAALECSLVLIAGKPSLVFTNLKDRPIAIYEICILVHNLDVRGVLEASKKLTKSEKYILLSPYGIEVRSLDGIRFFSGNHNGLEVSMSADFLTIPLFITKSTNIRAKTNFGTINVSYKDIDLLDSEDTNLRITAGKQSEKELNKENTCLAFDGQNWEIVRKDDPRIDHAAGKFGDIRYLKK